MTMKQTLRVRGLILTFSLALLAVLQAHGQMKIGNHPTEINRASILELESNKQGLLLTRIQDTSAMTPLNPPDGMIIYSVKDSALFIRANHEWKKLIDSTRLSAQFWNLKGNDFTTADSTNNILGTSNAMGFRIGTNNTAAIVIDRNGNATFIDSINVEKNANIAGKMTIGDSLRVGNRLLNVALDSTFIGNALFINDSVRLKIVRNALPGDDSVLVLGADHVVRKMSLDSTGVRQVAGLKGPDIYLSVDRDSTDFSIDSTSVANTIIFHMPYANGTKNAAKNGLVDSISQSFAGGKSFRDSVAVGTTNSPTSILDIHGNVGMAIAKANSTLGYDLSDPANDSIRTLIVDVGTITGDINTPIVVPVTLPDPIQGRIYTIKKIGKTDDAQLDVIVSIKPSSGTIEGSTKFDINNNWTSVSLQALDGSNWYIVGH